MFQLLKAKRYSYSGSDSYKHVESVIRNGKNVDIVSPFLDAYYARFLVRNARGKRIRILSSSIDANVTKILKGGGTRWWTLNIVGIIVAIDLLLYLIRLSSVAVLSASAVVIAACIFFIKKGNPGITLKVPKAFIHAKMYIADTEAVHGSANLTYAGMHKNIEHVEVLRDPVEIVELRHQFQRMWDSS